MRVLLAVEPVDFRAGIDGLAAVCRKRLAADPFSGVMFIFGNRRRTAIRVLVYDGQGFWLCTKRLSSGKFGWWPDGSKSQHELQACELQVLLMAGNPAQANAAPAWRPLGLVAQPADAAQAASASPGASCSW